MNELNKLRKAQVRIKRKFTFMLSIIAMLVLITATLAWFTLSNFASVNEINLKISTAPQLYLDIENRGTDVSQWKYITGTGAKKVSEQLLDPVTSSGGITMTNRKGTVREANKDSYLEFKVWFIATSDMWVHLSGQTVEVVDHQATTKVTTTDTGAKADIVRALRVSYEDSGSAAIWEPNKGSPVAGQTTFDVSQDFSNSTRLFHLDKLTPKQVTLRIWLEGEDPECDNDVEDSNVTIEMLFGGTDDNNSAFD